MKEALKLKGDRLIWIIVVLFAMISIVAVFSSSSFLAASRGITREAIFLEQAKAVLFGLAALFICYLIPLRWYRLFAIPAFVASVVMLAMLFVPGLQDGRNGAVRGLKIGGHTFQVFELVKICVVLYLAKALELWEEVTVDFKQFALKIILPLGAVCLMVMANSFSSALLITLVSFLLLLFLNVSWKNLGLTIAIVLAAIGLMFGIYHVAFAGRPEAQKSSVGKLFNRFGTAEGRIIDFVNDIRGMEEISDTELTDLEKQIQLDEKRQSNNAKVAISEGGLIGKGPGKSTQRYSLSMAFSDFIYAFIIEEYGLVGGVIVLTLYLILLFRCIRLCRRCGTTFSGALIVGLSFLIVTQAMLHILVNVRLIPITGHTLPMISHGGTAYIMLSGAVGIILSVNKQLDKQDRLKELEQQKLEKQQQQENITDEQS